MKLETFVKKSYFSVPKIGYILPGNLDPKSYYQGVEDKLIDLEQQKIVDNSLYSSSLEDLDESRLVTGLSLCVMDSDSLPPPELHRIFLDSIQPWKRDFFSITYQKSSKNYKSKPPSLLRQQQGTFYEQFDYVHEDFVFLLTHSPLLQKFLEKQLPGHYQEVQL